MQPGLRSLAPWSLGTLLSAGWWARWPSVAPFSTGHAASLRQAAGGVAGRQRLLGAVGAQPPAHGGLHAGGLAGSAPWEGDGLLLKPVLDRASHAPS